MFAFHFQVFLGFFINPIFWHIIAEMFQTAGYLLCVSSVNGGWPTTEEWPKFAASESDKANLESFMDEIIQEAKCPVIAFGRKEVRKRILAII